MTPRELAIVLTPRELATVLAALRYWQEEAAGIYNIALEAGGPLSYAEIDALCERLNT